MATRFSERTGQTVNAAAVRRKLRRARVTFAELLIDEIANSLDAATPDDVEDELVALGLFEYVRELLPPDWKSSTGRRPTSH